MIPLLNRGGLMKGFVQGADRQQRRCCRNALMIGSTRAILYARSMCSSMRWNFGDLGFDGVDPAATGRPAYHPSPMLKLYIYGYLNRVQSSRRLEREAGRNLEVDVANGTARSGSQNHRRFPQRQRPRIKKVCAQFVALCRKMGLLAKASVAIDGSKFKAVNSRDNNFTKGKMERRLGADRAERCALSEPARHRRSPDRCR